MLAYLTMLTGLLQAQANAAMAQWHQRDFFGLWSFARFARSHAPAALYDPVLLNQYQAGLDTGFHKFYPFPYPPDFLLLIWPLGALPYGEAWLLWTGFSALLFGVVMWRTLPGSMEWRMLGVCLALAGPAGANNIATGETGFLTSAALLAGLAWLPRRPVLAGLCLGLLSLKPQMAVLLPFALWGARAGRTSLAALMMAGGLAAASCLAFSPEMWVAWGPALHQYQALEDKNAAYLAPLMVSLTAIAQGAGMSGPALWLLTFGALAAAGWCCFSLFRRGVGPMEAGCLIAGTLVATPHAFFYDAPVSIFAAMMLMSRAERTVGDGLLCMAVVVAPISVTLPITHSLACLSYVSLFLRLVWLARRHT